MSKVKNREDFEERLEKRKRKGEKRRKKKRVIKHTLKYLYEAEIPQKIHKNREEFKRGKNFSGWPEYLPLFNLV